MLTLLAQSTPPADFGPWLSNLMYLCGAFAALAVAWRHLRGKPASTTIAEQPVHVTPAVKYVEEPRYERDQETIRGELARHSASRKGIYDRLEQQNAEIARLSAETGGMRESIADLAESSKEATSKVDTAAGEMRLLNQQVQTLITNSIRK